MKALEYKVFMNNIVADFVDRDLSVTITTEQAAGLLNKELAWVVSDEVIQLYVDDDTDTIIAEWPLSEGQMFYETLPVRPDFREPTQQCEGHPMTGAGGRRRL